MAIPSDLEVTVPLVPYERRLVCVPVKQLDQRALRGVHYALRIPAARRCAAHVAHDRAATIPLAIAWMDANPPVPLVVVDDVGGLLPSVRSALEAELAGAADEVFVVLSQPASRHRGRRFARDRAADRFGHELSALPGVWVAVLGVPFGQVAGVDEVNTVIRTAPFSLRTRQDQASGGRAALDSPAMQQRARFETVLRVAAGGALPLLVAVALVPLRDDIINANVALALMVVVVAAAAMGGRLAGAVAAVVSALSYDFFHTRPYLSFRITSRDDVETTVLLLVAGLIVGTVAWRALRDRASAEAGRSEIRRIHRLAEQVVTGEDPADVILAAEAELTALLDLEGCRFEAPPYENGLLVRLERGAAPPETRWSRVTRGAFELPAEGAELQVLSRGQPVGRFVLIPKPGNEFSLEQRVVAVALADQVGAVIATSQVHDDGRFRRYG